MGVQCILHTHENMGGTLAMKKRISYILILVILISGIFGGNPLDVHAEMTVDNFDLDVYRATEYLKKGSVCNNIITNLRQENNLPAQVIVRELDSKKFGQKVSKWELEHLTDKSLAEIAKGELDKKGYYELTLISIISYEFGMYNELFDKKKIVSAETNQILSSVKNWVKESDKIELDTISGNRKISKLTTKQKKELKKKMSDLFEKQHSLLAKSGEITKVFDEFFSTADTVYDAINKMAYYTNACEISNQSRNLIRLMYKDCPKSNLAMKEALKEVTVSLGEFNRGVKAEIQSGAIKESADILSALVDSGWEKVIDANPYIEAVKIGMGMGDHISDTFFATGETIELYECLKCLDEFYNLLRSSVQKLEKTYEKKKTPQNARNYLTTIDALFATGACGGEIGLENVKVLYNDTALGWLKMSKKSYPQFMSDMEHIMKTYGSKLKSLGNNYQASLKADYPSIYKTLIWG